jgi:uncharacterized membrane protein
MNKIEIVNIIGFSIWAMVLIILFILIIKMAIGLFSKTHKNK